MMYHLRRNLKKPITITLTLGASLLLGLLSFAGMYALLPLLGVSIAAFVLSVIYEGEIYQKNIENALEKLLDGHYTAELLGEDYLDEIAKKSADEKSTLPHFFKTYLKLKAISEDPGAHPSASLDKRLKLMRIWLGKLIINNQAKTPYGTGVLDSITDKDLWLEKSIQINRQHRYIQLFSVTAAVLMSLGTVYLILEVLPALPFIGTIAPAALPFVVLPMALVAGIAYGFLSYNAMTDFLLKNNLRSWWQDIKSQLTSPDRNSKNMMFAVFSAVIFTLNLSLTLFTAGTWWTVVHASQATWTALKNPVIKVISTLIPPIVSIATLVFNLDNTIHTIDEVKNAFNQEVTEENAPLQSTSSPAPQNANPETLAQLLNPFRILLKITFTPLLMLLFLGHLVSIGLTADRMPGIPAIVSALAGMISEGFEDLHYFFDINSLINRLFNFGKILWSPFKAAYIFLTAPYGNKLTRIKTMFAEVTSNNTTNNNGGHDHHHHEHSAIPTQVLELVFSPLFALSALWHWGFQDSQLEEQKTFWDCYQLQTGKHGNCDDVPFDGIKTPQDLEWMQEETYYKLGEHLNDLKQESISTNNEAITAIESLQETLKQPLQTNLTSPGTANQQTLEIINHLEQARNHVQQPQTHPSWLNCMKNGCRQHQNTTCFIVSPGQKNN